MSTRRCITRRARLVACAFALLGSLALASTASASRLSYDPDGSLVYTAAAGETNSGIVDVSPYTTTCSPVAPPCIHITDFGAFIDLNSVPAGCAAANQTAGWPQWGEAACPVPPRLRVDLGDMDDTWTDWDGPSVIDAGPGNDNPIYGGGGDDVIHGGPGNDVLIGGTGNDTIDGGPGDDDFEGIPGEGLFGGNPPSQGTDTYVGGGGSDSVVYTGRSENLSLSLDGVANDGAAGEHDNIGPDVTTVLGGNGDDVITGNDYANALSGDSGNDVITGGGGDDRLFGGPGADRLDAGAGQDYLEGGDGDDILIGGADVDTFYGEDPSCASNGCTGRDQIFARDTNAEFVACGPGIDAAQVDTTDNVRNWAATDDQCENLDVGPSAGGGTGRPGGGGTGATGTGTGGAGGRAFMVSAIVSRPAWKILVKLALPGPGVVSLRGTAHSGGRAITVSHIVRRVSAAGPLEIVLKLGAAARRALRAHHTLKTTIKITFAPSGNGPAVSASHTVVLRAHPSARNQALSARRLTPEASVGAARAGRSR
jgi:RTX calcium-binding nonapeptide repeat (4 copies)